MAKGVVVPMAAACSSKWVLSRTWDRFEIPRPFSRIAIVLGAPLSPVEAGTSSLAGAIEEARARAEGVIASRAADPEQSRARASPPRYDGSGAPQPLDGPSASSTSKEPPP
jgi:hypothetical protein